MSLRTQLTAKQAEMANLTDQLEAIGQLAQNENRDLSTDEQDRMAAVADEFTALETQCASLKGALEIQDKISRSRITQAANSADDSLMLQNGEFGVNRLPRNVRRQKSRYFDSTVEAYACGQWVLANFFGRSSAKAFCRENADILGALEEGSDPAGGFTVPTPLSATLIRLVESYSVIPSYSTTVPMSSDTLDLPVRASGVTVYYPGEGLAITDSDMAFGQVKLTARKFATLSLLSTEVNEDSVIALVDLIVEEMAHAFSYAIDNNGFNGVGTAPFGNITGIRGGILAGSKVTAADPTAITLDDLLEILGRVPEIGGFQGRWFMSRYTYYTIILPLVQAAPGTDQRMVEEGGNPTLLGYPITFTQVLPGKTRVDGDMLVVFGDLRLGLRMGMRRNATFKMLNELYAVTDQIGVQSTLRADIKVVSPGTSTEAGVIVGLFVTLATPVPLAATASGKSK
jgi:HK97 family phage major capsid protein